MSFGHTLSPSYSRLFAIIIGINDYPSAGPLNSSLLAAELDAQRWKKFLISIGCPESHILTLLGKFATRNEIVKAFENLANENLIEEGDPIVIFYAGHGGQIVHKTSDDEEHLIQMIIPSDYCIENGIYCIGDLEIGGLIDRIAETKGDNITVIMDCCHSASGTRGGYDDDTRVRSIVLPASAYDRHSFEYSNGFKLNGKAYSRAGLRSHILLAACLSTEKAHENSDGGHFSTALLELFQTVPLAQLRYCDILCQMKRISNSHIPNQRTAGCAHPDTDRHLSRTPSIHQREDLRIFIPQNDKFWEMFVKIRLKFGEDNITAAHLYASMGNTNEVTFQVQDRRVTKFGFNKRFAPVNPRDVEWVLSKISHYYRELDRINAKSNIASNISLGFYQLDDSRESDWRRFKPKGPNIFQNGVIDFEVEEGAPYGLKLVNKSARDLYPYVFFFNNSNFSIASMYETSCPTAYLVESPLKSGSFLTFGYGFGGVPPHAYKLDSEEVNVDFMKIIFTTRAIDAYRISQPSPFHRTRAPVAYRTRYPDGDWDCLLIPFIQRKPQTRH